MKPENPTRLQETLPLVPLRDMVVFPHMMAPFVVGRESSIHALEAALATPSKRLFLAAQKNPQLDEPSPKDIYSVGVVATVAQSLKLPNGHIKVMVEGVRRARILSFEELRDYLGGFDFRGDRVMAPVAEFSGGEKARLTLALLARQRPNLLLLDEPTNHLDIEMREALTEALQDYEGALVVVAHDRHLLRATADELWLVDDGAVRRFDGDLDDYRDWVLSARAKEVPVEAATAPAGGDRRVQKRAAAQERQRRSDLRKPLQQQLDRIEQELDALATEKRELDAWLAAPDAYLDERKDRLKEVLARHGDLGWQLARVEAKWLELHEALERIGA